MIVFFSVGDQKVDLSFPQAVVPLIDLPVRDKELSMYFRALDPWP